MFQILTTFYIGYLFLQFGIAPPFEGKTFIEKCNTKTLLDVLREFFITYKYAILEIEEFVICIWKFQGGYYLFDPFGRDSNGEVFRPEPPHGERCVQIFPLNLATVLRYCGLKTMALSIVGQIKDQEKNPEYKLWPIFIKRKEQRNFDPPKNFKEFSAKERYEQLKKTAGSTLSFTPKETRSERILNYRPPSKEDLKKIPIEPEELRRPFERPKEPSYTYFYELVPKKFGIMRARHHQNDPTFSRYYGRQSLANAVAAISMLREHKSRFWIKMMLDEILITGEQIYFDSKRNLNGGVLGIRELTNCIKINQSMYTPDIEEMSVIGRLSSNKFEILDLLPALEEFFTLNDAGKFI